MKRVLLLISLEVYKCHLILSRLSNLKIFKFNNSYIGLFFSLGMRPRFQRVVAPLSQAYDFMDKRINHPSLFPKKENYSHMRRKERE